MCTRDTTKYTGCSCERRGNGISFCGTALLYPHKPCKIVVDKRIEMGERGNRICARCQ